MKTYMNTSYTFIRDPPLGPEHCQMCSSDLMELKVKQDRERWRMESERYIAAKELDCLIVTGLVLLKYNCADSSIHGMDCNAFPLLDYLLQITALDPEIQYYEGCERITYTSIYN